MMDNEKAKMRIGLLPLIVIIGLILGAGYLLLAGDINLPSFMIKPEFRRVEGFPTIVYTSNTVDKQRIVIKSEEELTNFLNKIDSTGLLEVREPINFNKEYLIAVTTETNEKTGSDVRIKKISQNKEKNEILVSIRETEKGDTCTIELDKNIALDIVAISKTDKNIQFDRVRQVEPCN